MTDPRNVFVYLSRLGLPRPKTTRMYFTRAEKNKIIKEVGFGPLHIMEYWLDYLSIPLPRKISDEKTARAIGILPSKVKRYRLALQNANLFRVDRTSNKSNIKYEYCFGKLSVYTKLYFGKVFGAGLLTVTDVKKKYDNSYSLVRGAIDKANLSELETNDLYEIFDIRNTVKTGIFKGAVLGSNLINTGDII